MEKPLTHYMTAGLEPLTLREYEGRGGYDAVKKVLGKMNPADVTAMVKEANLKGRGGAGFSTGTKWELVPSGENAPFPRFLVANGDEMEPGAFKDRYLMEGAPHQLIEGMILAAYAIQANFAYIYVRSEYVAAARGITRAIGEARRAGYLGADILGSGFNLELDLHVSAGRYMCGEETALLNALEGRRAMPRWKPPYPQVAGLWGKPTVVNNVETLSCVPHIVKNGPGWFRGLCGSEGEGGTKIYGVSGRVNRPGYWELPMGTTFRELLESHAGGMKSGYRLRGFLPGGASTDFLLEKHLDVKMDFASVSGAGSRLGTGTVMVMDDRTCPVGFVHNIERFFARESCGWCTPCREGLPWVVRTLGSIEEGEGIPEDIDILTHHVRLLGPGRTFCALAPGAMEPLQSALKYFIDEFEAHIRGKGCPWR